MEGFDPYYPIEISKIEIQGNERTRESYFQHAFSDSARCQNINELHEHLSSVTRYLRDSGLFEGVEANIRICDHANQGTHKYRNRNKGGSSYNIAVDINVKEVGIPQLKMESYIQTGSGVNSGGGALQAALRNPFGYGEITKISLGSNTSEGQECSVISTIPNIVLPNVSPGIKAVFRPVHDAFFGLKSDNTGKSDETNRIDRGSLQLTMKKSEQNAASFISFKSLIQTVGVEYASERGTHTVSTELTLRDEIPVPYQLAPPTFLLQNLQKKFIARPNSVSLSDSKKVGLIPHAKTASQETMSNINSSSKASIQYTYMQDHRSRSNPVLGSYLKSSVELAVPSGVQSAQYVRTEITVQNSVKVLPFRSIDTGMIASFSGTLGALWAVPGNNQFRAYLTDRYHAGGPMSIRGFGGYGIGPRAPPSAPSSTELAQDVITGDALGGFAKSTFLGTLSVPINLKCFEKDAARAFFFVNAGSIGMGSQTLDLPSLTAPSSAALSAAQKSSIKTDGRGSRGTHPDTDSKASSIVNSGGEGNAEHRPRAPFFGFFRASVGAGISLALSPAITLEVTYSVPVLKAAHDVVKPFQLGVGVSLS